MSLTVFNSCKQQEVGPILEIVTPASITFPVGGTYVLLEDNADDVFANFKWTEADYNLLITVSYSLEVDLKSNNFSDPVIIGTTDADSIEITVFDFNKILTNSLGLPENQPAVLSVRVGSYSAASEITYSTAIDLTVTPYNPPYAPERLYILSGGEKIGSILPIDVDGNYEGYAWLPANGLKFILAEDEEGTVFFGDTDVDNVLEFDGDSVVVATEGHYKINVNSFDLSYTISSQAWGIIGSAVPPYDWSSDVDMAYLVDEGVWEISTDTLSGGLIQDGMIKFRPNDSWDPLNYGDGPVSGHEDYLFDGIPDEYGADIPISAGNYRITLDLREYPYSYTFVPL